MTLSLISHHWGSYTDSFLGIIIAYFPLRLKKIMILCRKPQNYLLAEDEAMGTKEYYYRSYQYDSAEIALFLNHVAEFIAGDRTVPVTKAPSTSSVSLFFTFGNDLFRMFLTDLGRMKKPYECAFKYGFRGYSTGGKNGVFLILKQDGGLMTAVESLIAQNTHQITEDLDCSLSDLPNLRRVKIVYHDSSGERVVGVMNEDNGRAIFLGFGQY